jgi:transcriptional antiterminator RfaH
MLENFVSAWHLIYTRPRHEKKVSDRLSELNIKSFFPIRKIVRQWHDRKKLIEEPLFPSYVFVYLDGKQSLYEGMNVEGYLYYVKVGKKMAKVDEQLVEQLKLLSVHDGDIEVSSSSFSPGRLVTICGGALTGLPSEIVEYNGKQKIIVRVCILQRNLLVNLPAEHLLIA